ncbi:MAG TPA: LytTR family DNA-binding domain-containing protein [Saprospiraceae bacterium]|nr:LytTR family DNA-binding domain-containing protein [Saprospiraceae bacterium]
METYKCFIVDDEPLAIHVIEQHLSKFNQLTICGTSTDPVEALGRVKALKPDLLFLDIAMPDITGLEFIESLRYKPSIILTTAYRDYAVEGFNLHVLDYLVKPIPFKRFVQAIDHFMDYTLRHRDGPSPEEGRYILVKADRKTVRIELNDILYVEGVKDYVKIVMAGQTVITKISIGHFLRLLPDQEFLQAHKSFIVSKNKIKAFTALDVEIGQTEIPIGRVYREAFLRSIEKK